MKVCAVCSKAIYRYNRSGLCKPCLMRSPLRQVARLATVANWPLERRLEKFQVRLGDDECWGWAGCHNGGGYPILRINKKNRVATHVALELDGRPRPDAEQHACHRCDNPICTNPRHLFWGTRADNMQDMLSKGRAAHQQRHREAAA